MNTFKRKNTFAEAIDKQITTTTNGMTAYKVSGSACVDLFFKAGAMRGKSIVSEFMAAYVEDVEYAMRIALWLRDVRGGAGERELYKQILLCLSDSGRKHNCIKLMNKTAELGRWDDLLIDYKDKDLKKYAFSLIKEAINKGDGLCAKWLPRKGQFARELREYFQATPKQYRKLLVTLSDTVEQKMSAKEWSKINYEHVPSVAASRYQKAFNRNDEDRYKAYKESLGNGEAKINAGAVYPYDIIKSINYGGDKTVALAQWESLKNYLGDDLILPMVDVSPSMNCSIGNSLTAKDIAISLGLYLADKTKSVFKDIFLTFAGSPELVRLRGNLIEKLDQMKNSGWGGSTNLQAAFDLLLQFAERNSVKQDDMPKYLLVLSDMQFDSADSSLDCTAFNMIENKYKVYGYQMPKIIFWNLNAHDNAPVQFNQTGVALVSGFSPAIVKSILSAKAFTPFDVMLQTIMSDRYNF